MMVVEQLHRFLEVCTAWPVLPASLLLLFVLLYGVLVLVGVLDLELLDFDLDVEAGSSTSIGFVTLKFLNIGDVPLMVWLSALAFLWWVVSLALGMLLDGLPSEAGVSAAIWPIARNLAVSVLLTKEATQPLKRIFAKQTTRSPEDLIGLDCEISTYTATPDEGQARFMTDGAPLLLNVRTRGDALRKGEIARIIGYDSATRIYSVAALPPGDPSTL